MEWPLLHLSLQLTTLPPALRSLRHSLHRGGQMSLIPAMFIMVNTSRTQISACNTHRAMNIISIRSRPTGQPLTVISRHSLELTTSPPVTLTRTTSNSSGTTMLVISQTSISHSPAMVPTCLTLISSSTSVRHSTGPTIASPTTSSCPLISQPI